MFVDNQNITGAAATVKESQSVSDISIPKATNNKSSSLLLSKLESELLGNEQVVDVDEVMPKLAQIEEAWKVESEVVASPTFKNILRHAKLKTLDKTLIVKVGSKMAKEMVINEVNFSRGLKARVKFQKLIIQVEVDPKMVTTQKNTKGRKVLSIKETYDLMKNTNPLVEDLRSRFDLKIDH